MKQNKAFVAWCAVVTIVCTMVSSVFASSNIVPPGTRADSMGGAYIAIADDASAIYWNPAGLAQLEKAGVEVSAFYGSGKIKSNTSLKNDPAATFDLKNGSFPLPNLVAALEPTYYQSKTLDVAATFPFVAGYKKVKDITIAVGGYVLGGGGGKWEDKDRSKNLIGSIDSSLGYMVGNVSAGKQITEKLALGLGLNVITIMGKDKIQKEFIDTIYGGAYSYTLGVDVDVMGYGLEVMGGAMYQMTDKLQLGAVLRSGSNVKLTGTTKATGTGAAVTATHSTDVEQHYAFPMTYGVGASYKPIEKLLVAAEIDRIGFSVMKDEITYSLPGGLFINTNESKKWDDTMQLRLGAEYEVNEQWAVRGGVQTDPNPCPTDKMTLLNTNQYNVVQWSGGVGYKINNWKVDAGYDYYVADKPSKDGRTYEYPFDAVRVGVGYVF